MRKILLAAALAGAAVSGLTGTALLAQYAGNAARGDTDGDGFISRAEFTARAEARFAALDVNRDGKISADEMQGRGGRMLSAAAGPDGTVTKAAFLKLSNDRFDKLDTNHDGKLSDTEMQAMRGHFGGRGGRGAGGGPGEDGPPPPPPGDIGGHRGHHGNFLAKLDTNGDNRISRDEMRANADKRFNKLDTNHDGYIDKAEMDALRGRMKMHGRGDIAPPPPPPVPGAPAAPQQDAGQ
ncbi:EF-hand domain-containing protein [Sphingomonas immobilis]|uniref:EF-hand domain-containing protein n=1 Tax=Sphingomonas immobilis TaxID=3063997 RepID=A0ABT8ZWQ6_9SPHN|nr:EF-hand domain-containing protein [Sphingomonas sp. CA1-15]MDO7840907.1 EF-hand domain-containing protein [Sphingomonas sp. CA1-15]